MDETQEKEKQAVWKEASTMEEWVEKMLRQGNTAIVKYLMKGMPESSKEKYRAIWARVKSEQDKENK